MNGNNGNNGGPIYIDDECKRYYREEELYKQKHRCNNCKLILCAAIVGVAITGMFFLISAGLLVFPPVEIQNTIVGDDKDKKGGDNINIIIDRDLVKKLKDKHDD